METFPVLLIAIPLGGAFLVPILYKAWRRLAEIVAGLCLATVLALSIYLAFFLVPGKPLVYLFGNWPVPLGIAFAVDKLSSLMLLIVSILAFFSYLFAIRYMDQFTGAGKFYTLYLLMLVGMNGVVMTGDLFNMFVFMEIAGLAAYALVAFGTKPKELEAGFKYMVMGEIASLMILLAIALIYAATSTLNLADLSRAFATMDKTPGFYFVVILLMFGFSLKAGLVPFHFWLPDAYPSAPAPVTAVLSGVFTKALGVYAMARILFNVYGFSRASSPEVFNALLILGLVSIVVGGLLALPQKDYKRLLAYSSISQIGYIVLALGIGNEFALIGAFAHILSHSLGKGLLFLTSGSVVYRVGERDITKFTGGLGKQMPWTSLSYNLGALSVAGMPPFLGFFSKLFIILGAVKAGFIVPAVVAGLFAVVTLGYLLKITNKVFWGKEGIKGIKESPFVMVFAMVCLVVLLVAGGAFFFWLKPHLLQPAADVLLKGTEYADIVFRIGTGG
ncbi:MAG: NADH/ubiquinone/plastoquinone (complex I) [Candidatus Stahlbacteria bacterium]|nr:MAG: NADH/ubiquinone/plastoquinone (complex I) [Candidatus Stahlbacteria bacterium]